MSGSARLARDERGATIVEFALVAPLLLALMVGIFQFGWSQHTFSSARSSVEQAARALLIDPTLNEPALQAMVSADLADTAATDIDVTLTRSDVTGGKIAQLTALYTAEFGVPGLLAFSIPYRVSVTTVLKAT